MCDSHPGRHCCAQVKLAPREGRSIVTTVILGPSRERIAHTPAMRFFYSWKLHTVTIFVRYVRYDSPVWEIRY